jgi:hypothetical protein
LKENKVIKQNIDKERMKDKKGTIFSLITSSLSGDMLYNIEKG